MECASCGSPNLPVAQFCGRCGQPLAQPVAADAVSVGSPVHYAAPVAQEPEVSSTRYRPPPSLLKGPEVGLWQRAVMGLAALVLLAPVALVLVFNEFLEQGRWATLVAAAGLGLGLAAVRPPHGVLRRILVALGALVILVVVGAAIIVGFLFANYYY